MINDPRAAEASLDPRRAALLAALKEPSSASRLAEHFDLSRQKINYYLKSLEEYGLITVVEERRKGNMTERVMQASAASYVISTEPLRGLAPDPGDAPDRFSARWMIALAARLIEDLSTLMRGAQATGQKLATVALDGEVSFASLADRAAFTEELSVGIATLLAKYDRPHAPHARKHRLMFALHPSVTRPVPESSASADSYLQMLDSTQEGHHEQDI